MKIDDYLHKTGIPITLFARRCGLTYAQVRNILVGCNPTLVTAIKIKMYTEGEIQPEDLLNPEEEKNIAEFKSDLLEQSYIKKK